MSTAPAPRPGVCFEVEVLSVTDGDTVRIHRLGSDLNFPLRLLDCWAPETKIRGNATSYSHEKQARVLKAGRDAHSALGSLAMREGERTYVFIPFSTINGTDIMDLFTLGRVLGELWIGETNASEFMVSQQLAYRTKQDLVAADLA